MKTEADAGGTQPQAQGCLEPPGAGRGRKDPPREPPEEAQLADTLILDFWLQTWRRMDSCCLKPPSLRGFVTQPAHCPRGETCGDPRACLSCPKAWGSPRQMLWTPMKTAARAPTHAWSGRFV